MMPKAAKKTPTRFQPYPGGGGGKDLQGAFKASGRTGRRNAVTEEELSSFVQAINRKLQSCDELTALVSTTGAGAVPEQTTLADLPANLAKLKCSDETTKSKEKEISSDFEK